MLFNIVSFINNLTPSSAYQYLKKDNIEISFDEIRQILPILKQNLYLLENGNKDEYCSSIRLKIPNKHYLLIQQLLDKYY